jgi:hypothetical protein
MRIKNKDIIPISLSVVISVLFVSLVVYGATTIGTNINTGGNLTASGWATTTSVTTTEYAYVGDDITEPTGWDFLNGDLLVSDDLFVNSQATTSGSLWVGNAGTANNLDMSDDLYVEGDLEVDGTLYGAWATTTSATTTAYAYVGPDISEHADIDFLYGDLIVSDDINFAGTLYGGTASTTSATTTDTLSVGFGTGIREINFGTCDFANTAVTASSSAHFFCTSASGVTSSDKVFVTATSSFDTEYVIETASSTAEAEDKISIRVRNLGHTDDDTLNGTSLNWMSIR